MLQDAFIFKRRLGIGATAEVFLVRKKISGDLRALKVFTPLVMADQQALTKIRTEMKVLGKLDHPNIVKLYGGWGTEEEFALELEYVDGQDLRGWKKELGLPFVEPLLWILCQVARGLGAAHEQGVLHRDLKPENILISRFGEVKLSDFGLARELDSTTMTQSGLLTGSIGYLAPETLSGQRPDQQSDIFSFGVVAYELLSGKNPFSAETPQASVKKLLDGKFASLRESAPGVPKAVATLVESCLAVDPEKRPASIWHIEGDFQLALARCTLARFASDIVSVTKRSALLEPAFLAKKADLEKRKAETIGTPALIELAREWSHFFPNAKEPVEILEKCSPETIPPRRRMMLAAALLLLLLSLGGLFAYQLRSRPLDPVAAPAAPPTPTPSTTPKQATLIAPTKKSLPTGWIKVHADPEVQVFLDGRLIPLERWDRIEATAGSRQLKLLKDGYLPIVNQIDVKANKIAVVKARGGG